MSQINLKIITPEKEIFNETVDAVNAFTQSGEIGILPNHINLMTKLAPGELKVKKGGKVTYMATGDGFLQVSDNTVTIMTDMAVDEDLINEKAVEEAKKRAQQALEQKLSNEEYAETLATLEKSLAQLRVKRRHRTR